MNNTRMLSKEEETIAEEIGDVVFQTALLQFLATLEEEAVNEFENFLKAIADKEDFMEQLFARYPELADILISESESLEIDIKEIVPD